MPPSRPKLTRSPKESRIFAIPARGGRRLSRGSHVGAAHATLVAFLPDSKAIFDAALEETLRAITDDSRRIADLEVGRNAAAAILTARENDGENRTVEYTPGTKPGDYRPTPPDFKPAALVQWESVTPFVLGRSVPLPRTAAREQFACSGRP